MPKESMADVSGETEEADPVPRLFSGQRLVFIAGLVGWLLIALTTWIWIN
jgi:hypothetical protein